jgi:hypothetical protein
MFLRTPHSRGPSGAGLTASRLARLHRVSYERRSYLERHTDHRVTAFAEGKRNWSPTGENSPLSGGHEATSGGTASTGTRTLRVRWLVTLPASAERTPERPRVPTTTRRVPLPVA